MKKESKSEELYPFKDFKFPDKKTELTPIPQPVADTVTKAQDLPPVVVPSDREVKIYDNSEVEGNSGQIDDLGDEFFEGLKNYEVL